MSNTPFTILINVCFRLTILGIVTYILYINLKDKPSGYVILVISIIIYIFYYIVSRSYLLENYDNSENVISIKNQPSIIKNNDIILDTDTKPFIDTPINSIDDYEYNMVFDNENDRELTQGLRDKLMSQYPMDWSTQPASSSHYQKGLKTHEETQVQPNDVSNNNIYKNITGNKFTPPDIDSAEAKERKVLKTYIPKNANDLTTYNIDDAYELINKMYDAKGLIPQVEHKKNTNIYEIVGTRKKGEKVEYEDELGDAEASDEAVKENQESVTVVPPAARDILYDSDPFYNKQVKTRTDKWDYTKYTPELERMFAPTYPTSQWY